jgi:hypothetical protein
MTEAEKAAEEVNKGIAQLKEQIEKGATKEQLEASLEAFKSESLKDLVGKSELDKLQEIVKFQGETITELKGRGSVNAIKTTKDVLDDNIEEIRKSISNNIKYDFTIKTLATRSVVLGNTDSMRDNDISPLASKKLSLYDLFRKIRVGKNNAGTITYRDWTDNTVRAAAMVAEGAAFPESAIEFQQRSVILKKIGDSLPMTDEFQYDTAMFADEVDNFLNVNVKLVQDSQLLSADGTGNNITGLLTYAPAYTAPASGIAAASLYDLIPKVAESITKDRGAKFSPNVVLLNLTDINKMRLTKDANQNYVMPPFVDRNGQVVAGMTVIEENGLSENTMVVGDTRFGVIYEDEEGYTLTTGEVNNQFLQDEKTLKARKRIAFLIKEQDKKGWAKVVSISASLLLLEA